MGLRIEDGRGRGYEAGVNKEKQLLTLATMMELGLAASNSGKAFFASTGLITLTTTGSYSGLLYVKNGHTTSHLHVGAGHIGTNSIAATFKFVRNPVAGTLISAGTAVVPANMNFSSGAAFSGTALKGADGQTITDGTEIMLRQVGQAESVISDATRFIILPPTTSLAVLCQPSATAIVNVGLLLFFHESDD